MSDEKSILKDWPNALRFGPSVEHLHALGAISLGYNRLEHSLSSLLSELLKAPFDAAEAIHDHLNNSARVALLKKLLEHESEPAFATCVSHALEMYDSCTTNRNTVAHIIHEWHPNLSLLVGKKKNSKKTRDLHYFIDVQELRQVADEIQTTLEFIHAITSYRFRQWHDAAYGPDVPMNALMALAKEVASKGPNKLPDLPAMPRKLEHIDLP